MKSRLYSLVFLGFLPLFLLAQVDTKVENLPQQEKAIMQMAHTIMFDSIADNRLAAHAKMKIALEKALRTPGSFRYSFDSLQTISFQYPVDSSFRIVTWQLYVDVDQYEYAGFIQTNAEQPVLSPLTDKSEEVEEIFYDVLTADSWYGAVYYKIRSFETPEGMRHLLFGFDGHRLYTKRKIVDVLYFEDGKPLFGAPVFSSDDISRTDLYKNRLLLEYSAEAAITLNYNEEMEMIVMDHLIPFRTSAQIREETLVPDGSYEGYKLEGALWVYKEKLFHQVSERPPRPAPILDKRRGKDIMGKKN